MRKLIFLFLLVLIIAKVANSATKLDFRTVDELTYRYYNEQKWDSVIGIGKKALRQDIDYYYLRVRMGISYFEKREYFPAVTHLKKAREFNSGDPVITDYLYRSYLYSNHYEEAELLKASMPKDPKGTQYSTSRFVDQIHFEGGYTLSSDNSPKNISDLMGKDSIYGEQDLYGNSLYSNLGLKLKISKRVCLSLAYSYLNFNKTKYIQYGHFEDQFLGIADSTWGKNYLYSFPWVIHDTSFSYKVNQHEVHVGATAILPAGFKIMPAFHFIHVGYTLTNGSYTTKTMQDTAFYTTFDSNYHTFSFTRYLYSFDQKDTSFNNYLVGLRITKDLGIFNLGLSGSWSNLNHKKQIQAGVLLTYYPLGNLNFYGTTMVTGFFQEKDKRLLLGQVLGAKITPWMWLEGNFYWGDYTNANIYNGSVVYNNSDIIDYRAGANLVFNVGKHLQLSLIYQYFKKESQQLYYIKTIDPVTNEVNEVSQIKTNAYNTNTIIGGITWKL
jgi:hypothetical protein